MSDHLTARAFHAADGTQDWRVVGDGATAFFATESVAASGRFVAAITALPEAASHVPAIDLRADGVTVRLLTTDADWYGMSQRDVDLARAVSAVAREQGLTADPARVQSFLVIPGASDTAAVMPFWQAVLGYVPRPDSPEEDLVDPRDRGPALWFEAMDEPRPGGLGAIHLAVWLPIEQAQARIDAAIAAGGRVVFDRAAPSWVTLADAAGNEIDVASVASRD